MDSYSYRHHFKYTPLLFILTYDSIDESVILVTLHSLHRMHFERQGSRVTRLVKMSQLHL